VFVVSSGRSAVDLGYLGFIQLVIFPRAVPFKFVSSSMIVVLGAGSSLVSIEASESFGGEESICVAEGFETFCSRNFGARTCIPGCLSSSRQ